MGFMNTLISVTQYIKLMNYNADKYVKIINFDRD